MPPCVFQFNSASHKDYERQLVGSQESVLKSTDRRYLLPLDTTRTAPLTEIIFWQKESH